MSVMAERRSISGIRGTVESLTCDKVTNYAQAFATFLRRVKDGNTVVVGVDTRPTSAALGARVIAALRGAGWDVIDLGVVPTPTVQLAIAKFAAAGGVVVTASHNPIEYNGVKFLQNREGHGTFLEKWQCDEVFGLYDAGEFDVRRPGEVTPVGALQAEFDVPPYTAEFLDRNRIDWRSDNCVILDYHLHRVVSVMGRELDKIRGMNFAVAMDCCGGAGSPIDYVLLDYLYCRVKRVNAMPGVFTRPIEPTPANLAPFCAELASESDLYDAGFVTDCDNDRCVLVARNPDTGQYQPLEEDYTLAIAVDQVLATRPPGSTVVTNWSTSQMLHDITSTHHANLRRAPTGEVYTACEALHYHAAIAGEGSCAGVIDPRVGIGRDTLVALWHILAALACKRDDLYTIAASLPRYHKVSRDHVSHLSVQETRAGLDKLQQHYAGRTDLLFLNREDGLIVYFADHARVQIRSSNTEPLLRVRSEASTCELAEHLVDEALGVIGNHD